MADVFISYQKANRSDAERLAEELKARGFSVWWDSELYAGYKFPQAIVDELDKAKAVIVLWSDSAVTSDWVRSEAERARTQRKIIAAHVPGFDPLKILPPFGVYHTEVCTNIPHLASALARYTSIDRKYDAAIQSQELLPFLKCCSKDELDPLVQYIQKSWTETLNIDERVVGKWPDHTLYTEVIDQEFRLCGGHLLGNLRRGGEGPAYSVIVADVCSKLKVPHTESDTVQTMELALINKLFKDALDKMSPKEREELEADIDAEMRSRGFAPQPNAALAAPSLVAAGGLAVQASGFLAYQYGVVVANYIAKAVLGHGLALGTNAALTRGIGLIAGPPGWIFTGVLTALTLAGAAYRVTMPSVAHIAHLRLARMAKVNAEPAETASTPPQLSSSTP
jgi:uncharacterized protein YaaW (UPF0174 family)